MKKVLLLIGLTLSLLTGCSDKSNFADIGNAAKSGSNNTAGDTVYIPLNPAWSGFNNPQAILIGKEPFIYVCDTDNDRIVMLNTVGSVLGSISIKKPVAIAQDYRYNLIVCAEYDTLNTSYSAVYKIDLFAVNHNISLASKKLLLPKTTDDFNHPRRKFTSVATFYDNSFYVGRTGPDNASLYDPDNAIVQFVVKADRSDSLVGNMHDMDPLSAGLITANGITSLSSFSKKNLDFIATFAKGVENETQFKAQWFQHYQTISAEGYKSPFSPGDGIRFVQPGRFGAPKGSCIDPSGNIFIADSDPAKDSVFKFSAFGDELQSFGGSKAGFVKPVGVAFFDKTLYVLDAGANKIFRFVLSTDL